jgi:hypothetical protein
MRGWGIFLAIFGVGAFVLPMMGLQFKLISIFHPYEWLAGIVALGLGVALFFLGGAGAASDAGAEK